MSREKVVITQKIETRRRKNGKTYQHHSRVGTPKPKPTSTK